MPAFEYKVIPAPTRGRKAPGVKTSEARFALGLEGLLCAMGRDGWDYLRSDILPSEERHGLTSNQTVYRSVLVFRREIPPQTRAIAASEQHDISSTAAVPRNDPKASE